MTEVRLHTRWLIEDRTTGRVLALRSPMDEATCRRYVARHSDRYRLMRVDITETWSEVPVEAPQDPWP